METISYLLFGALIIYIVRFIIIERVKEHQALMKRVEARQKEKVVLPKKNEHDFYGTDLLKNDPENFLKKLDQKKQKLANGESVGVNAAEAFYLIRNNAHKDLIVGEDGTINMKDLHNNFVVNDENVEELKNKILNFQPAGRDKNAKPKVMQIPGYVKEVQQIKDGATRWVFEEWHAKECGIKTLCWDRFGRAMLDPDEVKEDPKNKSKKKDSTKGSRGSDELTDLSKKMSRVLEMEEERRVDIMLSGDEQNKNGFEGNEIKKSKKISSLKPAVLKDEIVELEKEFVVPGFFATLDDEFESELHKDLGNEKLNSNVEDEVQVIEGHL